MSHMEASTRCQESQIAIFVKEKEENSLDISSSFQSMWKAHGQSKPSYTATAKLTLTHSSTRIISPCKSGIQQCKLLSHGTFHLYDGWTDCSKVYNVNKQLSKFLVSDIYNLVHSQLSTIIPGIFICFHNCFNTMGLAKQGLTLVLPWIGCMIMEYISISPFGKLKWNTTRSIA